jgi:hypothetical protein
VRLNSLSDATGCEVRRSVNCAPARSTLAPAIKLELKWGFRMQILGKCEFLNPGGSVKDRVAAQIVQEVQPRPVFPPCLRETQVDASAST